MPFPPRLPLRAALGAAVALTAVAPHALAQTITPTGGKVLGKHGAWTVMCDTPPGAPGEQCGALQEVVSEDRPDLGLTVLAFETADGAARVLRVIAPLNIFLPRGLGLNIDGTDLGRAVFARCVREGCQAEVVMDDALVKRLEDGRLATFIIFQSPERGTGFPLELDGFTEAFAAAKAGDVEGRDVEAGDAAKGADASEADSADGTDGAADGVEADAPTDGAATDG